MNETNNRRFEKEPLEQGLFIVIEGSDGSGKKTQTRLLTKNLKAEGHAVKTLEFPNYKSESCYFVKRYLNGDYGSADEVDPRTASLFFALDRFDLKSEIETAFNEGLIVVSDRFAAANLAHQGTKIKEHQERLEFFEWLDQLEFGILKIPRPTVYLVLDVPVEISMELLRKRHELDGTTADIHEKDYEHQKISRDIYLELHQSYPENFKLINCVSAAGEILTENEISEMIWRIVQDYLPDDRIEA